MDDQKDRKLILFFAFKLLDVGSKIERKKKKKVVLNLFWAQLCGKNDTKLQLEIL